MICIGRMENYLQRILTRLQAKSVVCSNDYNENLLSYQFLMTLRMKRRINMLLLCSSSQKRLLWRELSSIIIVNLLLSRLLSMFISGFSLLLNTFRASFKHFFLLSTINLSYSQVNAQAFSYFSLLLIIFKLLNMEAYCGSEMNKLTRELIGFWSS